MKELTIAATVENIEVVTDFVNQQLEELACPMPYDPLSKEDPDLTLLAEERQILQTIILDK